MSLMLLAVADILRFDIKMDNPEAVQILECFP
jgi:hypothetical protein